MMQNPDSSAQPGTAVKIRASAGKIGVTAPALFDRHNDANLHTLIERVFQSNAVDAISVDRNRTSVEIRFDRRALSSAVALQTFSEALSPAPSDVDLHVAQTGSLLRPYLDRLPGRVKRVERRRGPNETLELGASAHPADGRIVTVLPSPASPVSAVVVDVLVVEFDSSSHVSPAANGEANALPAGSGPRSLRDVVFQEGRRLVNLAAAGGCFVMSIVGLITPGIPTVPFVLATGYFLARSSPALHERFKRSAFFGQMVRDYEERGGLRFVTKLKMTLLTLGLILVTVIVTGGSLPFLIVAGAMGGLGIYLLNRIPTIKGLSPEIAAAPAPA